MLSFIIRRLALMVPVLFGLSVLLFLWLRALPGDPAGALLGERATPEAIARINAQYGFDKPLYEQYFTYITQLAQGNLGKSTKTGEPVLNTFMDRLPATLELGIAALLFAILLGIPLGYLAARKNGTWIDTAAVSSTVVGIVVPVFFLAYLLKYVFALQLSWFPTAGRLDPRLEATRYTNFYVLDGLMTREWDVAWDAAMHLVLPAVALGTIPLVVITRITRASVLEVLNADYVRTAQAKGLPQGEIRHHHVLRNALLPVITTIGLQSGMLFSGAVLTETVFSFNGVGFGLFEAITQLDYPILQGYMLFIALMYALINLAVDVTYGIIDPRIRVS